MRFLSCVLFLIKPIGAHSLFAQNNFNHAIRITSGINAPSFDHPFFKFKTDKYFSIPFEMTPDFNLGIEWLTRLGDQDRFRLSGAVHTSGLEMYSAGYNDPSAFTFLAQSDNLYCFSGGIGVEYKLPIWRGWYGLFSATPSVAYYYLGSDLVDTARLNQDERKNAHQPHSGTYFFQYNPGKAYHLFNFQIRNKVSIGYQFSRRFGLEISGEYIFGLPIRAFEWSYTVYMKGDQELTQPISYEKAIFSNSGIAFNLSASWRL